MKGTIKTVIIAAGVSLVVVAVNNRVALPLIAPAEGVSLESVAKAAGAMPDAD